MEFADAPRKWPGRETIPIRSAFGLDRPLEGMAPEQKQMLRGFFGRGRDGALLMAGTFRVPAGLTRDSLERYHELARRWIVAGKDKNCSQVARFCLIERALAEMEGR